MEMLVLFVALLLEEMSDKNDVNATVIFRKPDCNSGRITSVTTSRSLAKRM